MLDVCGIFTRTSNTSRQESQVSIKLTEDDRSFGKLPNFLCLLLEAMKYFQLVLISFAYAKEFWSHPIDTYG